MRGGRFGGLYRAKQMTERARVALCLSGQMRMFETCIGWIEDLQTHHDVDIFIHTWSDRGVSSDPKRSLPLGLINFVDIDKTDPRKPIDLNTEHSFRDMIMPKTKIDIDILSRYFDFVRADIEDLPDDYNETKSLHGIYCPKEILDLGPRYYHNLAMFYKIYMCDNLRSDYQSENGFEYDIVIRARPDRTIKNFQFPENKIKRNEIYIRHGIQKSSGMEYMMDQFAFGGSDAMRAYATIWENLGNYWNINMFKELPIQRRIIGRLIKFHLEKNGVHIINDKKTQGDLATDYVSFEQGMRATHVFDEDRPALARTMRTEMVHYAVRDTKTSAQARTRLAEIQADPQDKIAARAYIAIQEGRETECMRAIGELRRLSLTYPTADLLEIDYHMRARRWYEAMRVAADAQARWPDMLRLLNLKAKIYMRIHKPSMAIEVYDEVERLCYFDSERKACYRARALAYEKMGDFEKANTEYSRILTLYKEDDGAQAGILRNSLRLKTANIEDFKRLERFWRGKRKGEQKYALLYADYVLLFGDQKQAEEIRTVAKKFPDDKGIQSRTKKFFLKMGQSQVA